MASAQSLGSIAGRKENLDLPFDAGVFQRQGDEGEENAPGVVRFYGQQYEGDGVFFVIDRSKSMAASGQLERAKKEVRTNLFQMTSGMRFAIVMVDFDIMKYPSQRRPAILDDNTRPGAMNWMATVTPGNTSCVRKGLVEALKFANRSESKRNVLIYVGDGGGDCLPLSVINGVQVTDEDAYLRETLAVVRKENYKGTQVNTVGVMRVTLSGERFLRELAAANQGSYTRIK